MANDMPVDPRLLLGGSPTGGFMGGQPASGIWGAGQPGGDAHAMGGQPSMGASGGNIFSPQPILRNGQIIGYMPTTSDYTRSLSPADQQARLQTLRQTMPGASDEALQYFDNGDYYGQPGPYTNYLNRRPSQWELAAKARSDAENSHRGFWNDAGKPLALSALAAVGTGGLSIAGQAAGATQAGPDPQMPMGRPDPIGGNSMNSGGGLFDNLLGNLGNLSPAILAGYLGNQQRQDVMGQVGKLNTLGDSLSGPAFMNSITNPYDLQTGQGRTALTQNLQQRGVGGSSFGNQQLGNYDYMRGLGRGDLATRAQAGIAGTQGQLYSDALRGIVGGNAAYNQLAGAGLGASGSLFNRPGGSGSTGNGLFDWLRNLGGGGGGGTPGIPSSDPNIDPNTGLPANYPSAGGSIDPNTGFPDMGSTFDPNIDWSSLYG
jgi:hypothetical protein